MIRANLILILSAVLWGVWGLANKFAVVRAHPFTVQWMFAVPLALSIPVFYWLGRQNSPTTNLDSHALMWAIIASLSSLLATVLLFFALRERPASIATAITSAYPLITLLLAVVTGQETLSLPKLGGIILILGGVLVLQLEN